MKLDMMKAAALILIGVSLSGCNLFGHKKSSTTVVATPPPASAKFEDQFGSSAATFGDTFRVSPNSEPRDANAGDVIPVNPTAEPVPLPGT